MIFTNFLNISIINLFENNKTLTIFYKLLQMWQLFALNIYFGIMYYLDAVSTGRILQTAVHLILLLSY